MSANFTGVTFPNQKVTPANDAVIRRAIFDDGILTGCDLSYSGSTLTMTAGQLMICGRQIIHPSSQNWAVTEATSGYARLVLTIDVTRTSTKDTFDQVVDEIQYATDANGFADLTTADINATGTRYQVAVCLVSLGPGGITGIASKLDMTEGGGAGGVLTVTVIPGELVTVSHGDKSQTKAANASGVAVFKGLKAGAWTVAVTRNGKPTAKTVIIVTDYSVSIPLNTIPEFTYTGDYEIVNDSDEPITVSQDNWKIRFLTSGTLTFTNLNGAEGGIDVFLVGGGGNGETIRGARGGGGGYTKTVKGVSIAIATPYTVTIGASSGTSSAFGASANGASGANGGSGGGGGGSSSGTPGNGGSNGGNGTAGNVSGGGTGQGTTTREFGESTGKLYSGGGGGSAAKAGAAGDSTAGAGAAFGGAAKNGVANTGGGGGAAYSGTAGAGGSGIVIIRNVRGAA
jgi:hypothetical protein|nr:MAG TPA: Receptor Binding Protein sandwich domain, phage receptor [Caudoviricetes sp.]